MPNKQSSDIRRKAARDKLVQRLDNNWTRPGFYATITMTVQNGIIMPDIHEAQNYKLGEG